MSAPGRVFRVGIIGTGGIAHAHAQAIRELSPRVELVAVADVDPTRAADFAAAYGAEAIYADAATLVAGQPLDLVHICTPPQTHTPLAIVAMRAGVPALVEEADRPQPRRDGPARRGVRAETGIPVLTVFLQHRFGAAARHLKALVESGELGRPLVATCETLAGTAPTSTSPRRGVASGTSRRRPHDGPRNPPVRPAAVHPRAVVVRERLRRPPARPRTPKTSRCDRGIRQRRARDGRGLRRITRETSRLRLIPARASRARPPLRLRRRGLAVHPAPGQEHRAPWTNGGERVRQRPPRSVRAILDALDTGAAPASRRGPPHPGVRRGDLRVGVPGVPDRARSSGRRSLRADHERRHRSVSPIKEVAA